MFDHLDAFAVLNSRLPLSEKILSVHRLVKQRLAFIDRIAVAIYDPKVDLLKTYVHSSGGEQPLSLYDAKLADSISLSEIVTLGRPRVLNDLAAFYGTNARITKVKYGASYTLPIYSDDVFSGFLFFNSYLKNVFDEATLYYLDLIGHMLSLLITQELAHSRTLVASVRNAADMVHQRDFETGGHLERMSSYARLIGRSIADKHQLSDEWVEHVFMFSPLHDVGKIAIPDSILLKPGKLNRDEFAIMQTHASKGVEIIDQMLENFDLRAMRHVDMLRNIARSHHEALDGSGYPAGLTEDDIALEAKIVAVADVFDALTSTRPYKAAWANNDAFEWLWSQAGIKFDRDCAQALIACREEVEHTQQHFQEDYLG